MPPGPLADATIIEHTVSGRFVFGAVNDPNLEPLAAVIEDGMDAITALIVDMILGAMVGMVMIKISNWGEVSFA